MTDIEFDNLLADLAEETPCFSRMNALDLDALSAEQRRRLVLFLRAQAKIRESFAGAESFVARVMAKERAPADAEAFVESVMRRQSPKKMPWRSSWLPWSIAAAACLMAMGAWWRSMTPVVSPRADSVVSVIKHEKGALGVLVQEVHSSFTEVNPLEHGFMPGRYTMTRGLAHVRLVNGTDLVLKAPVTFSLETAMRLRLESGGLRARVPPQAHGFTVATEGVEYRDLGTEFTVSAGGKSGASSLQVYDGAVDVYDKAGKKLDSVTVGGAVSFQSGKVERGAAVQPPEIPGTDVVKQQKWLELSTRLRGDPSLLAYYSFERDAEMPTKLPDVKTMGEPAHGEIHGARWVSGRWPGKRALFFDRDEDFVETIIPGEHQQLTVAAWVLLDRLDYNNNAIFASNGWAPGAVHLNVSRYARLFGGAHGPTRNTPATQLLATGVWSLLVMTVDAPGRRVDAWLNGRHIYEKLYESEPLIRPGTCRIGSCLPPPDEGNPLRTIRGRIDELAVWKRVLGAQEIENLYHDGCPNLLEQVADKKAETGDGE